MRLVIVALSPQPISLALLGLTLAALVEGDLQVEPGARSGDVR